MDILERIRELYPRLTKKQKGIADYLISNPEDICYITLAQLSQNTSASELTLLRFCQKLGCENFLELKNKFREYTQYMIKVASSPSYFSMERVSGTDSEKVGLLKEICEQEAIAATDFFNNMDVQSVAAVAEEIRKSKCIYIFAHDISKIPGSFLESRLRLLYFDAELVDLSSLAETQRRLEHLTEGDLAIFFSFPKYFYPMGWKGSRLQRRRSVPTAIFSSLPASVAPTSVQELSSRSLAARCSTTSRLSRYISSAMTSAPTGSTASCSSARASVFR